MYSRSWSSCLCSDEEATGMADSGSSEGYDRCALTVPELLACDSDMGVLAKKGHVQDLH
jgi:hypothetical protein